ncbi:hypothetical protein HID58_052198, partial [Brassica napus]
TLRCILQVHGKLTVSGLKPHNQLINAYSLFQRPNLSRIIFDSVQDPGVVLCNSMIRGYTRAGLHREALELFRYMSEEKSIVPDKYSFTFALKACTGALDLERGLGIHELVSEMGFESDVYIGTALVEVYCKGGDLVRAREVFDEMPERDVVTWNIMVSGFVQNGCFGEALRLFRMMGDVSVATSLVSMYSKCGELEIAEQLFTNITDRDVVTWSAMIASFELAGHHDDALSLFRDMMKTDVKPNTVALTSVLPACAGIGIAASRLGKSIHCYAIRTDIESELAAATAIISMYAKSGLFSPALKAFERLPTKDAVAFNALAQGYTQIGDACKAFDLYNKMKLHGKSTVSWNLIMNGYLINGQAEEAIAAFRQMKNENFQPNIVTFVNILHAAAQLAVLRDAMSVHARLIRFGYCSHTAIGNGLVDMYAKCGMIESSERCFVEIRNKDMVSWNTMLSAYAVNGLASCAVSLFLFMQENQLRLDSVPFLSVLSACRHAGLVEEGKRVFKDMEERHEIEVGVDHYACMVDLLGKAGLFGEAVEIVRRMRVKASVGVWGALLSCSRMHCNLWLSNAALCQLVKLEPLNPSHYGQELRLGDGNDGSRIKKIPACSWIQV